MEVEEKEKEIKISEEKKNKNIFQEVISDYFYSKYKLISRLDIPPLHRNSPI